MIALEMLVAFVEAVVWVGGWSMLVGLPVAWLRIHRTPGWAERPDEGRSYDLILLGEFIQRPVWPAILWAWLTLAVTAIADVEVSSVEYVAIVWGPATIFVPAAVLWLDTARVPRLVEEMRERRPA